MWADLKDALVNMTQVQYITFTADGEVAIYLLHRDEPLTFAVDKVAEARSYFKSLITRVQPLE